MIVFGLTHQRYELKTKPFSTGGEGDIYDIVGLKERVIKLYHPDRITNELEQKIIRMVKRPPNESILSQVAWPLDAVYDAASHFCGFLMPRLQITAELSEIYAYPPTSNITYKQKLTIAQNICAVISAVHAEGYVFGDFNPRNIGINTNNGTVAFLDTDSYHIVVDKDSNKAFRCNVCAPGYAAPELLAKCSQHIQLNPGDANKAYATTPLDTFTKETDNFALAIHIFKLLMNGYTPFNGIPETSTASTASPGVGDKAVERDSYCFKPGNKPQSPAVPGIDILPQEIADLFTRAFMYGRVDPKMRPNAEDWYYALQRYEKDLVVCQRNAAHMYKKGLTECPWCAADNAYRASIQKPLGQTSWTTPVTPIKPQSHYVPPPVSPVSSSPSGGTVTGSQVAGAGGTGGSAYIPPQPPQPTNVFQKYKIWIIGAVAILALIMLIRGCSSNNRRNQTVQQYSQQQEQTYTQEQNDNEYVNTPAPTPAPTPANDGSSQERAIQLTANTSTENSLYDDYSSIWYVLELDNPGTITFTLEHDLIDSESAYWRLRVYNSADTENELMLSSFTGKDTKGESQLLGLGAGTYYVRVTSGPSYYSSDYFTLTANYESTTACENESNDSANDASALPINEPIVGSLDDTYDIDWFLLKLTEAGTVQFNLSHDLIESESTYWRLWVYDAVGFDGYEGDLNDLMMYSYVGKDASANSQLLGLAAGEYFIKITAGPSYSSVMPYTMTVNYTATDLCEKESDDSPDEASDIALNGPYVGSIDDPYDADWYKLTLTETGIVTFNLAHELIESESNYWRLWVYDSLEYTGYEGDLNELMFYSFMGKDVNKDAPAVGLGAGTYYVKVTGGPSYSSTTPYTLTPAWQATTLCEMEINDNPNSASPLSENSAYQGSIDDSYDADWYSFTLNESAYVSFTLSHNVIESESNYWRIWVYDSSNFAGYEGDLNELLFNSFTGNNPSGTSEGLNLGAGTYYVKVTGGPSYSSSTPYYLTLNR